jgi:hypothetical protein
MAAPLAPEHSHNASAHRLRPQRVAPASKPLPESRFPSARTAGVGWRAEAPTPIKSVIPDGALEERGDPGPICGRPPIARRLSAIWSARLHPYVRPSGAVAIDRGQDGLRDVGSNQPRELEHPTGSHGVAHVRIERSQNHLRRVLQFQPRPCGGVLAAADLDYVRERFMRRLSAASARGGSARPWSASSRRCGRACWRGPRRRAWAACARAAPSARASSAPCRAGPA